MNSNFKFQISNCRRGFTIIELVISIFVLSVGVVGVFSAFSIMAVSTSDASDRFTATYLAQEGMEIVRNTRDNNWLAIDKNCGGVSDGCENTWLDGLSCADGCEADYKSAITYTRGNYLILDSDGFYVYHPVKPSAVKPKFQRKIKITCGQGDCSASHFIDVVVEVSWDRKATLVSSQGQGSVTTEETLYDWY